MSSDARDAVRCQTEGCPRRADPGEEYCSTCRLETCLFHRELRWSEPRKVAGAPPDWPVERR